MALLPCPRCGKVQEARTGKKYCDDCRLIVRREQKAEAARTFRKVHKEKVREQDRIRDQDPARREAARIRSLRNYAERKGNLDYVLLKASRSKQTKDKLEFGGNRRAVFERDGAQCVVCGSIKRLEIHHKDGLGRNVPKEQKNNSMDNLVLLCKSCHKRIHATNQNHEVDPKTGRFKKRGNKT